jgi:phospholipid/cholesterol/gamma-HCH transport system ATP-binding protein
MLKIHKLYKSFNELEILKGIDAEFQSGETSLVIGQSGSGKTVLLKCLLGLYNFDG